jgi:inhibitor of cysteine peptidase
MCVLLYFKSRTTNYIGEGTAHKWKKSCISLAGRTIELTTGQVVIITLEANPTTGYTWEVVEAPSGQIMRQVGEIEFESESDAIGAGGVQIIKFEVVNAGQTSLTLAYHRPWETDVEPLNTFSINVIAR